ncbi:Retrovirus-related Pol polyprotein from transposon TNT 1-94 [Podosphaera aphanis]|nr:Retrovirus-related Pol polyprotein from transposon TNT 1-94 [Podosphaera aphanis]
MSTADILKGVKNAPVLSKSTYARWSKLFRMSLFGLSLDQFILESVPELSDDCEPKPAKAFQKAVRIDDNNVRAALLQLVPEEVYFIIESKNTARQMWLTLKAYYQPQSDGVVDTLLEEFWSFSMSEEADVDEYANELTQRQSQIASLDPSKRPSDTTKKSRLLRYFESTSNGYYGGVVACLKLNSSTTFSQSVNILREAQSGLNRQHEAATVAHVKDSDRGEPYRPKRTCAFCRGTNHVRESCFDWIETPDGTRWASKNPSKAAIVLRRKEKYSKRKEPKVTEGTSGDGAWILEEEFALSYTRPKNSDVILDTGATCHIFHDKSLFTSMSPTKKSVQTASGHSSIVSGIGSVIFHVASVEGGNRYRTIKLDDVWYLPSCTRNLVSGSKLITKGLNIRTNQVGLGVYSSENRLTASVQMEDGLFRFSTIKLKSPDAPISLPVDCALISQGSKQLTTRLIHHRFAHVGPGLLRKICASDLDLQIVKKSDMPNFHLTTDFVKNCDTCNSCKQVEKINRGPIPRASNLLDLIHSDVWGKCRVSGIQGNNFFVSFTDDASRESKIYPIKSTKDVQVKFQEYKQEKELQTGLKIKAMRFDGGAEYKKIKFHGITRQISAPYTQHQNGVAERLNRTIITMARCMLEHAHLPMRFWEFAVTTACYLKNRMPILPENKTPFEIMQGKLPIVSHLRVWGCICYTLVDTQNPRRYKLLPTSQKGIFIGYCESSTQYRVYIPSKIGPNKIAISANVRFLEDSFWDWSNSDREQLNIQQLEDPINLDNNDPEPDTSSSSDSDSDTDSLPSPFLRPREISVDQPLSTEVGAATEVDAITGQPTPPPPIPTIPGSFDPTDGPQTQLPRSTRIRKPIEPRSAWQPTVHYVGGNNIIPQSYSSAINGADNLEWKAAIHDELESLRSKQVFTPVTHVPHGRRPIGSRWVFTVKSDGRFKARLVAQGFSQVPGIDYFDTYSPTLRMDSLRIMLAVSAFLDWEIHQIDIKTAYLEGDLSEEIYMRAPEGMSGTKFVRVNKALYGLKQSGKAWNDKLSSTLISFNFKKSSSDQCIYIHNEIPVIIGVYVDDLVICGENIRHVNEIKGWLSSCFPVKDIGIINTIIGWQITRDRPTRTLRISQASFVSDKIDSLGLSDAKIFKSPMEGYDAILPAREEEQPADNSAYPSAIGSLGYASNSTRPDIAFAASQLARFNSAPVVRHWNGVCRVYRYLKGSSRNCITYSFGIPHSKIQKGSMASIYSDSDFASDTATRRSVSGYLMMLGGGPTEYIAIFEASKHAIWATRFLEELNVAKELIGNEGMKVYTDNQSALALVNGTHSTKAKHIDVVSELLAYFG